METKTTAAKVLKKCLKVQIQLLTVSCTGYVYNPSQRRLLDVLNGVLAGALHVNKEFLPVSKAGISSVDGSEIVVQNAYLNKANILFVKEIGSEGARGIGGEVGHKPYPFVSKSSVAVKLYMPSFTLTGQMHCAKGQGISDVLESETSFIPLTNVDIHPSIVGSESGVGFMAVNKGQIISLEEPG